MYSAIQVLEHLSSSTQNLFNKMGSLPRVRIVKSSKYIDTVGSDGVLLTGVVIGSNKRFGVLIDETYSDNSQKGLFWYGEKEFEYLDEIESEETNMKLTGFNKVAVITQGYGGTYYYALYDDSIEVGDKVLVSGAAEGKLHTVSEVISAEEASNRFSKDITAEVICKVDMSAYDKRVADRKEAKKIKDEMNRIIKQMDEVNKYEMYAKNNPELDAMLRKYKDLVG